MYSTLSTNWWLLAIRGVVAILFGILVFFWPTLAWLMVVVSFAIYALIDGVFAIATAVNGQATGEVWWALILEGVLGIAAGVLAIFYPGITQLALLWVIAFWAIATGIMEIVAAIRLRKEITGEWFLAGSGVLSVIFGIALLVSPVAGAIAIAWLIGAYAIVFGATLFGWATEAAGINGVDALPLTPR